MMMLDSMDPDITAVNAKLNYQCWMQNGGGVTEDQFFGLSSENRQQIVDFLVDLPTVIELPDFFLVHAGLNKDHQEDIDFSIWAREEFYTRPTGLDKPVIFGHTPVMYIDQKNPYKIWHGKDKICLDTGACHRNGKLSCLCIDTMEEFYV
jgi:serine/threonine protein phosphatase 1